MTSTTTPKRALRRYHFALFGGLAAYAGALVGAILFFRSRPELDALAVVVALSPGIGILAVLHAMWRYLRDMDEVGRFFAMRALVFALFGVLVVSGVWGVAELIQPNWPRLPVFWMFPTALGLFGVANCFGPGQGLSRGE